MEYIDCCGECKNFDILHSNKEECCKIHCRKKMFENKIIPFSEVEEFSNKERNCENFKARYIRYPITVNKINYDNCEGYISNSCGNKTGDLVKIRPCDEEFNNKTYLGIFIGEVATNPYVTFNENNELNFCLSTNPMIYIPELKRCIFGYESWWSDIENEDGLKDITDEDINNTWYVKAIKDMFN